MKKLGRYDILRVLGKGAMGMVYEARDPNLDRRVAIKTIKVENLSVAASAEYEARFRTEARSAARLQHPNIVSVYDSDRHGNIAYLVMEYVQGEDLKHHLDSGRRFTLEQTLSMVLDLLSALDYAHRQNVVHRDVKPANLLIPDDGRVKLTDFGVARIQDSGEATRTRGSMVGTLKYMSPEQVQGQPIDARADLFAAGVVLYQLLTGRRPFDGETDFAIIQQIITHAPPAPSSCNPLLPRAVDAVVARALAKSREQRFASAQEFAAALQEACGRASDRTILPPLAGSAASAPGTGSASRPSRSLGSTLRLPVAGNGEDAGSTVTQELELVYWKDVKDSSDLEDLTGFLHRFPDGIYSDLARRRLKKLVPQAAESADAQATRLDVTTVTADASQPTSTTRTVALPEPQAETDSTLAPAPGGTGGRTDTSGPGPQAGLPAAAPDAPGRARNTAMLALAGVAALVLGGLAFQWLSATRTPGPGAESPALAASAAAAVVHTSEPASAAIARVPADASAPTASAPAAVAMTPADSRPAARAAVAGAAQKAASAAREPAADPSPVATGTSAAAPPPVTAPRPPPAKPAAAAVAAAAPAPADPAQACTGRVLLGYQVCLNQQCAKPAFASHALCEERRAAEKLRRDAQGAGRN